MNRWMKKWVRVSAVAVLMALGFEPGLRGASQTCYTDVPYRVCACYGCTYVVVCGVIVSAVPQLRLELCTGNNPGVIIYEAREASSGLDDYSCTYLNGCGTATAVGTCCGGARTSFSDWSTFTWCKSRGAICKPTATGQ